MKLKFFSTLLASMILLSSCSSSSSSSQPETSESSLTSSSSSESMVSQSALDTTSDTPSQQPTTISLVIPEGYTLPRIGMRLEELGVCSVNEFLLAAQTVDFNEFVLVSQQESNPNRCYKLEGYLFPDTYEIYANEAPESIIRRLLSNNEKKINGNMRAQVEESEYTYDEILTIASIIEKEAYERNDQPVPTEMPLIASVLYNRLEQDMPLQCNVTATYVKGAIDPFIADGFALYNDYYNTYHTQALPPGAICNPSLDAINAALNPAQSDYLFFVTDADKNFYYAATYEEHLENLKLADVTEGGSNTIGSSEVE